MRRPTTRKIVIERDDKPDQAEAEQCDDGIDVWNLPEQRCSDGAGRERGGGKRSSSCEVTHHWGLTPELSRAAKRRRLGRIVRPRSRELQPLRAACDEAHRGRP